METRAGRVLRSTFVRRSVAGLALFVVVVGLIVVVLEWSGRNRGEDTTCPFFLKMSPEQQRQVIVTMGAPPAGVKHQVARALSGCKRVRGTADENDALELILGP